MIIEEDISMDKAQEMRDDRDKAIEALRQRLGSLDPHQVKAWRAMSPARCLDLAFQAYQFAVDAMRLTERQCHPDRSPRNWPGGRHAVCRGIPGRAGKRMEPLRGWACSAGSAWPTTMECVGSGAVRRIARASGILEGFEDLLEAAQQEVEG